MENHYWQTISIFPPLLCPFLGQLFFSLSDLFQSVLGDLDSRDQLSLSFYSPSPLWAMTPAICSTISQGKQGHAECRNVPTPHPFFSLPGYKSR